MALEYWHSSAYTRDGEKFMETTMVFDTGCKAVVEVKSELLIPREELERRKAALPPLVVYR